MATTSHKSILVTGVAGSGKSSICEELKKRDYEAYDIEDIAGLFRRVDKITGKTLHGENPHSLESVTRRFWVCDKKSLRGLIRQRRSGLAFYCGNASNLDELLPLFDEVVLLRASPAVISERLRRRTSKAFGRDPKVRRWVLGWKGDWENHFLQMGAVAIDANRSISRITKDVIRVAEAD